MAKQQKKLGDILIEWGIITQKEVAKALDHAKAKNVRIGEALVALNLCGEVNVYKALAQQHNMEPFDSEKSAVRHSEHDSTRQGTHFSEGHEVPRHRTRMTSKMKNFKLYGARRSDIINCAKCTLPMLI